MFKALGWDVDNEQGYAEAYKDVVHEDAIQIGGATKAPDYCFRIGGTRKFFLEAKKPSVNIKATSPPPSSFAATHGPRSFRCPSSPTLRSSRSTTGVSSREAQQGLPPPASCICRSTNTRVAGRDRLGIFEEAMRKGSFDRFAESAKGKKGTAEVDAAYSEPTRPAIPIESGHPFRGKAATHSEAKAATF